MYYVYVIESIKFKRLYKGFTSDIPERVWKHNQGKTYSTKPYIPYRLIYYEAFLDINDAIQREKILKSKWGTKFIKRVLNSYFNNNKS
ncbi:MAG: GIY-YIG nuclease family protein [Patescibacteria group bacterium]|jgi:putative endonuclease